ncbi:MAG: TonB-dependent receptor plug domain-containing protein [Segetibacter sp.]
MKTGNLLPMPAVSVSETGAGTVTGGDGRYAIPLTGQAKTLVVSYVGKGAQTIRIGSNTSINISLRPETQAFQEVVVVAYGTQKRSEVTAAISTVNAATIKNQQVVSVGQALQGTAPGVSVTNTSGQPGDNPVIRIRGVASIGASADPLIVVDGVVFNGNLNMISPNDIDNFSILKDAAASALYGSRAANGVILINTKMGRRNAAPSINLSAVYGISSRAVTDYPYLNTQQHFELGWEGLKNTYAASSDLCY